MNRQKILCVDDEPHILEGLSQLLRRLLEVHTATSGAQGLEVLAREGPFAVVISDMRMPGMDGAAFLARVRQQAPDSVRMLLTGHADLQSAIAAVNEGQIFRFLTKPCPPDQLRAATIEAVRQYELVTSERVLLEETLHGSIKVLTDILSMTSPVVFGRATRIKQLVGELAGALDLPDRWPLQVAAMLSPLGAIALPDDVAERYACGAVLTAEEEALVARIPALTRDLLASIPRMEPVLEILAGRTIPFERWLGRKDIPVTASVLRIAEDYEQLESSGIPLQLVLDTLRGRKGMYAPDVLRELVRIKSAVTTHEVREIPLSALRVGMVLAQDVRTKSGALLVTRGHEVTQSFLARVRGFRDGQVDEPLRVVIRPPSTPGRS
jgi:response regulator RpfG family c-di-GMP phosphodiesterase